MGDTRWHATYLRLNPCAIPRGRKQLQDKTMLLKNHAATPRKGERVRIRRSWRSPYSGCTGVLVVVETDDSYGAYVVQFDDGMQFRYQLAELKLAVAPSTPFYERVIRVLSRLD